MQDLGTKDMETDVYLVCQIIRNGTHPPLSLSLCEVSPVQARCYRTGNTIHSTPSDDPTQLEVSNHLRRALWVEGYFVCAVLDVRTVLQEQEGTEAVDLHKTITMPLYLW